jgi:hypothetical protein
MKAERFALLFVIALVIAVPLAALMFDRPGKYTFYCTSWCGPNHWRMRGIIEVTGTATETITATPPLYVALNLDLDAPHPGDIVPGEKPSAARGVSLGAILDRIASVDISIRSVTTLDSAHPVMARSVGAKPSP